MSMLSLYNRLRVLKKEDDTLQYQAKRQALNAKKYNLSVNNVDKEQAKKLPEAVNLLVFFKELLEGLREDMPKT